MTRIPITKVEPKSGWFIIKRLNIARTIKGLKNPRVVLICPNLLTQYPDMYINNASLLTSDGWILIGPILIHLVLPFTSVPMPGSNSANNNRKDDNKKNQS